MKIVKLTHPTVWLDYGHWGYENHTPYKSNQWGEYKLEINNDVQDCDFWVIHGDLDNTKTANCPRKNIIFVTNEEKNQIPVYTKSYLDQFGSVVTSRDDITHNGLLKKHYICPWSVQKTYSELIESFPAIKKEIISAIISNNQKTIGHKKRYDFTQQLKKHFKDQLTWYCKGESSYINDKWDGLASFQYSLAIENSSHPDYFTEKITDCYLANTMPIYYGCPNIAEYFPDKSMVLIDIENPKKSIEIIEQAIAENWFEKYSAEIKIARELVLNKYQFIAGLIDVLNQLKTDLPRTKNTIRSEGFFQQPSIVQYIKKIWS